MAGEETVALGSIVAELVANISDLSDQFAAAKEEMADLSAAADDNVIDIRASIADLQDKIAAGQEELADFAASDDDTEVDIRASIADLTASLTDAQGLIDDFTESADSEAEVDIRASIADITDKIAAAQDELADFAASANSDDYVVLRASISDISDKIAAAQSEIQDFAATADTEGDVAIRANIDALTASIATAKAELAGLAEQAAATNADIAASGDEAAAKTEEANAAATSSSSNLARNTALIGVAVAAVSVKMAADFQQSMTELVTGAGMAKSAIGAVSSGILTMAGQVGQSTKDLAAAEYLISSAGFTGANSLNILRAAAEGARVGNADLATVADAVTSALNAYGLKASDATSVTNQLIASVAAGKMHLQDLANALSAVLPVAAAAHVSLAQVGGAIATMTSQGMSAQQAAQDIANTIRSIQNPSSVAIGELEQLGLTANQTETMLGKEGLTGTLTTFTDAITSKMGPAGTVILNAFNQSKSAAADLKVMVASMPASVAALAKQFESGALTMSNFRKEIPTNDMGMISQFEAMYEKVNGFNNVLKAGSPAAQTYTAALAKMMGGATGLNTALLLMGTHAATFKDNVKSIGEAAQNTKNGVMGWADAQKDFNTQIDQAKDTAEALAIRLGDALLPALQRVLHMVMDLVQWFERHRAAAEALGIAVGVTLVGAIGAYTVAMASAAVSTIAATWPILAIIAACAAVGAAIYELVEHWHEVWGEIKRISLDAWHDIDDVLHKIPGPVLAIAAPLVYLALHWRTTWEEIKRITHDAIEYLEAHWKELTAIALPLAPFLAFFAAIGVAIYELVEHFDAVVDFFKDLPETIGHVADDVIAPFKSAWDSFSSWWSSYWGEISAVLRTVAAVFRAEFAALAAVVRAGWDAIAATFTAALRAVEIVVEALWPLISGYFRAGFDVLRSVVEAGLTVIETVFKTVFGAISVVVRGAWDVIDGILRAGFEILKGIVEVGLDLITGHWSKAWHDLTTAVSQAMGDVMGALRSAFADILGYIAGTATMIFHAMVSVGSDLLHGFLSGIEALWSGVVSFFTGLPGKILAFFRDAGTWLLDVGKDLIEGLIKGAVEAPIKGLDDIKNTVIGGIKKVFDIFSPAGATRPVGHALIDGISAGMKEEQVDLSGITNALSKITSTLKAFVSTLSSIFSTGLSGSDGSMAGFGAEVTKDITDALAPASAAVRTFGTAVNADLTEPLTKATSVVGSYEASQTRANTAVQNLANLATAASQRVDEMTSGLASAEHEASVFTTSVQSAANTVDDAFRSMSDDVHDALSSLVDDLHSFSDETVSTDTEIEDALSQLLDKYRDLASEITGELDDALSASVDHFGDVDEAISRVIDDTNTYEGHLLHIAADFQSSTAQADLFRSAVDSLSSSEANAASGLAQLANTSANFGSTLVASVQGLSQDLYNVMWNLGGDMLTGLDNSISQNQGEVLSTVENVMGGVLNTMKSMMGIASPSKKTFEIGANITGQGLAGGILSGLPVAVSAMRTVMAAIANEATTRVDANVVTKVAASLSTQAAQARAAATPAAAMVAPTAAPVPSAAAGVLAPTLTTFEITIPIDSLAFAHGIAPAMETVAGQINRVRVTPVFGG